MVVPSVPIKKTVLTLLTERNNDKLTMVSVCFYYSYYYRLYFIYRFVPMFHSKNRTVC